MAKTYRVTPGVRPSNAVVGTLLRRGVRIGRMTLLTVPGRKSGQPRTTSVTVAASQGRRWLFSPSGEVNWVRNLRAAGRATRTRGRHAGTVSVVGLTAEESAPVRKQSLASAPAFIRAYFDGTPASPLAEFECEARRHPVFQVCDVAAGDAAAAETRTAG